MCESQPKKYNFNGLWCNYVPWLKVLRTYLEGATPVLKRGPTSVTDQYLVLWQCRIQGFSHQSGTFFAPCRCVSRKVDHLGLPEVQFGHRGAKTFCIRVPSAMFVALVLQHRLHTVAFCLTPRPFIDSTHCSLEECAVIHAWHTPIRTTTVLTIMGVVLI